MPDGSYCVLDAKEVTALFDSMRARMKRAVLRKALVAAINILADAIRNACPDDGTGALKASIKTLVSTDSSGLKGSAKIVWADGQGIIAARVEFGHANVGHQPELKLLDSVTEPHPFIFPACDLALPKALAVYQATVESELIARDGL
jgi:hypothetical protein